ncbi:MAG: class I SAM-dependent RNA methyltransferase, partial [Patulibacter sp.]|nr:class I SAM-dependent RNA methyltransferase [Patulibacter sp.]
MAESAVPSDPEAGPGSTASGATTADDPATPSAPATPQGDASTLDTPVTTKDEAQAASESTGKRVRPPRPHRGEEVELRVDSLAHGGNGVARTDGGWVVFVRGGIPGDRVRASITKRKKDYGEAVIVELLEPSPERIPPVADHPGAPWQVLPYERQLEIKAEQVEDALRRIGGHKDTVIEPIIPSESQWRYRNKLEYSFGAEPDADGNSRLVCGFHAAGSWQKIEHIEDCLLASELGNRARNVVYRWCLEEGLEPYDRKYQQGFLRNLVIREGVRTGDLQVRIVTSPGEFDVMGLGQHLDEELGEGTLTGLLWTQIHTVGETTYGGDTELVGGDAYIHEEICGLRLRISPEGFFQTNTEMAE